MSLTMIEKILANHSTKDVVISGEIIDIGIDVRAARDFGGPNVGDCPIFCVKSILCIVIFTNSIFKQNSQLRSD